MTVCSIVLQYYLVFELNVTRAVCRTYGSDTLIVGAGTLKAAAAPRMSCNSTEKA